VLRRDAVWDAARRRDGVRRHGSGRYAVQQRAVPHVAQLVAVPRAGVPDGLPVWLARLSQQAGSSVALAAPFAHPR